jgi:AraC-like DNA-binding protein
MLETSSASVETVGREVGYEDAASFRRLFKRLAGMGPGEYRRKFQLPAIAISGIAASPGGSCDEKRAEAP